MAKLDLVAATELKYGVRLPREYAEFLKNGLYRDMHLSVDGGETVYFVVVDKVHGHSESKRRRRFADGERRRAKETWRYNSLQ